MPNEFFRWLVNSPWSHAINSYEWVFPTVQSLHFIGFAMSIGTIAIVDFRLLGLGMRRQSPAGLESTSDHVVGLIKELQSQPSLCSHLEMETYTWAVLPESLRSRDVSERRLSSQP